MVAIPQEQELFNPFPGLRPFEPDEDHLFFGRETKVDELLIRLDKTRFLTVVGASGSGKSSLVRSGLIPYLHSGYMVDAGSSWRIAILRPGDDPIANLADSLSDPEVLPVGETPRSIQKGIVEATLRRGGHGLVEVVRQSKLPPEENLLVLVDQFEEIFRFKRSSKRLSSADESAAFVTLLLEAAKQSDHPIFVALTMRSDFLGNCTEFQELPAAINRGLYLIPRMTREERRAAITGPVAVGGAQISQRLVLRLLNDGGDDPDQLPILQHALRRTWDYWADNHADGEPLDLRHYEAAGTTASALSLHAEEALADLGIADAEATAEKVFKCITEKGSHGRGIRRPSSVTEVRAVTGLSESAVYEVVETFRRPGTTFVVPPAGTPLYPESVIDISHESLMRVWGRLRDWVDEEAQSGTLYKRLAGAAERFHAGTGGLWRGTELELALAWEETNRPSQAWAERYDPSFERAITFLRLSREERDKKAELEELTRKRRLQRTRRFAIVLGLAALLLFVASFAALLQKLEADEQKAQVEVALAKAVEARDEAREARDLAQAATEEAERASARAMAAQEQEKEERLRAEKAFLEAEAAQRQAQIAQAQERAQRLVSDQATRDAEAARLKALAAQEQEKAQRQKAEQAELEANRLARLELSRRLALQAPRLRLEHGSLMTALVALKAYELNRESGSFTQKPEVHLALRTALEALGASADRVLEGPSDAVRTVALSPGGSLLAAGSNDGGVYTVDLDTGGDRLETFASLGGTVRSLAFDPDGRLLAAGGSGPEGYGIRLWDLEDPSAVPRLLTGHADLVYALVFIDSGSLASASADGSVRLWNVDTGAGETLSRDAEVRITALTFDADEQRLAAMSKNRVVRVWEISAGAAREDTQWSARQEAPSLSFSPDGQTLAYGTRNGRILRSTVGGEASRGPLVGHRSGVSELSFSADGRYLASSSLDGSVLLWPLLEEGQPPVVLDGHSSWVWATSFARDGRRVYSGSADGTVREWVVSVEELAARTCAEARRTATDDERTIEEQWERVFPEIPYEDVETICED